MARASVSAWRWTFQPWSGGPWLDHTYVGQGPGAGNNPPADYFGCWAQGFYETQYPSAPVVSGNINYNCANCYRDTILSYHDTAGIGIYGVNGVCHQSANCFLFSAGPWAVTLNFSVLGYWASLLAYGTYGTNFPWWLAAVYEWCSWWNPAIAPEMPQAAAAAEPPVVGELRDLYASFLAQPKPPDSHDVIIKEAETVVRHHIPGFDPSVYRDLHKGFLSEKDAAIATGATGKALADKLNDLSKQLQLAVADRVGPEHYKKLNGVDAGQTAYLCDPRLEAAVGVPVPPFKHG
jgi:hypothetical protein